MASLSLDQELERLFDWNPPVLTLSPDASKSKHSRKPAFYDKHLSEKLILLNVRPLTSLRRDIAAVVDRTLSSIRERGIVLPRIQLGDLFYTVEHRRRVDRQRNQPMRNEMSVVNFFSKTTANYCVPVASTLALHPSAPDWDTILEWDGVPSNSGYAIANGVLRILPSLHLPLLEGTHPAGLEGLFASISRSRAKELAEVAKRLPDLMTSEVKSLSVASKGVMAAVGDTARESPFKWVHCHNSRCGHHKTTFGLHTLVVDAAITPWTIPSETSSGDPEVPATIQPGATRRSDRLATRQPGPSSSQVLQQESSRELDGMAKSTNKQDKPKAKGKRKRVDDNDDYEEDATAHEIQTAHHYLQQAWAQAVRTDSTLICLHAGSYEYIGVRHRATQQLFLSDLIHTHTCQNPGYGKLHVGLYIAALEDAIDRVRQLVEYDITDEGPGPVAR